MASRKSLRRSALLQLPCGCFAETRVVLDEKTEHLQLPPTRKLYSEIRRRAWGGVEDTALRRRGGRRPPMQLRPEGDPRL
ncbi:hypothetical protein DAI22_01g381500 [Oryza sativa Japonica Group]|nr:hypothetical protein DAI22_01g381500 [Oryza sativa Japonica Group]